MFQEKWLPFLISPTNHKKVVGNMHASSWNITANDFHVGISELDTHTHWIEVVMLWSKP